MGSRYGKTVRDNLRKVIETQIKKYKCPSCSRVAVKRKSHGVWECRKCGKKFASGAYEFFKVREEEKIENEEK